MKRISLTFALLLSAIASWAFPSATAPSSTSSQRFLNAEAEFRARQYRDENGIIPTNALIRALEQKMKMPLNTAAWPGTPITAPSTGIGLDTAGLSTAAWVWLGPGNIGGRVRSILSHPTNSNIMWAGGVGGGVWKSLNGGASWSPLNDFMANLAIASMVLDPTDPNVLYVGTGEGFSNADALRGAGIFKSIDGGTTWTQLSSTANSSFFFVNRLAVCPTNHLVLLAATGTGIWRSTNGGTNWTQTFSGSAMLDIDFHPTDGTKAIASGSTFGATGRALYSTDGGQTWLSASGISTAGRIEVAYAASSPTIVYASCNNNSGEIYASTDGGATYTLRNTGQNYLGAQGWYDNTIWVDPTNPNILMVGGLDIWRSTDGGTNITDIGGYSGSIHPDQHCIVQISSYNGTSSRTLFIGNDGGIFRATDAYTASSGNGWTTLNNNLGITQFYGAAGNPNSGTIVGGTQDNGTLRYRPSTGPQAWTSMFGGDGGECAADPTDANYFYGEYVYLQIHRSSDGGASSSYIFGGIGDAGVPDSGGDPDAGGPDGDPDAQANFISPFILDPNNSNIMLGGGSNLWRSVNVKAGSPSWSNIKPGANGSFISAIAVAPGNSDIIWVGHNNGDVYSTSNGTTALPTWTRMDLGTPNLPNRVCNRLVIDPTDPNRVYATFGGFNSDNIYRTTDGGTTWTNLAAGLPAAPVRSLVIAPFNTNYLYAGTEVGVFASADGGISWSPGNEGAANASVNELFWMGQNLVAATHARGLFKIQISDKPVLALAGTAITAQNCPPGNGVIDPGETVVVNFTLANSVSVSTSNLVATLLATNGVVSPSGPQNYGIISAGTPVTRPFTFTATGACGGSITALLQVLDGTNNLGTLSASFLLGTQKVIWAENFDTVSPPALPAGWTATLSGAGAAWTTTTANTDSAPNSAYAPDPTAISDNQLTSPSLAITNTTTQLTFRHSYSTEVPYDGAVLEISIAGGAFTDIVSAGGSFATNGYTANIPMFDNPLAGRNTWSGNSGGFITSTANLPPSASGQSVRFRWRFGADTGTGAGGWYVDSIALIDGVSCCTGAYVTADLSIAQTASPSSILLGSNVTFNVSITNLGLNIASSVAVTDSLPAQLSFVSATSTTGSWATNGGGLVVFNLSSLSNNAAANLSVTARSLAVGTFTNLISVSGSTADPNTANNSSTALVTVTSTAAPPPQITSISVTNNLVTLIWSATSTRTYRMQYKDDLTATNWIDLTPDIVASGTLATGTSPTASAAQRFYRVLLLP